jgi:hypothetical protein
VLAQALRDNPDIRLASTRLAEAEAELNRVRLQVTQKVVTYQRSLELAREEVKVAEQMRKTLQQLVATGQAPPRDAYKAEYELVQAKAKLAQVEAELPYLTGKQPAEAGAKVGQQADLSIRLRPTAQPDDYSVHLTWKAVQGSMAEKIRAALDRPVDVQKAGTVGDLVQALQDSHPEIHIQVIEELPTLHLTLGPNPLSFGAALQLLEDVMPGYRTVVRDYGLLIARENLLPPGAVFLNDFRKGAARAEKGRPLANGSGPRGKVPPSERVEGQITKVSPQGLVVVSIGSDAGLAKGQTLEVFRLAPKPMYLGTLRIMEVKPKEAVGQPVGKVLQPLQVGDRVAARLSDS